MTICRDRCTETQGAPRARHDSVAVPESVNPDGAVVTTRAPSGSNDPRPTTLGGGDASEQSSDLLLFIRNLITLHQHRGPRRWSSGVAGWRNVARRDAYTPAQTARTPRALA